MTRKFLCTSTVFVGLVAMVPVVVKGLIWEPPMLMLGMRHPLGIWLVAATIAAIPATLILAGLWDLADYICTRLRERGKD